MCEQHNMVNEKLNKPKFSCTLEELAKRWRTGNPRCWKGADGSASDSLGQ